MIKVEIKSSVTLGDFDSWFGVCPGCKCALPPLEITGPRYFEEGIVECVGCHATQDLWDCVRSRMDDEFPPAWALQGLGAHMTFFPFDVLPGQIVTIDLTEHNVPRDAVLLYSSYQSDDVRAIPRFIELFSKQDAQNPTRQTIYCMPVQDASMERGPGHAMVCWIERGSDAQASVRLANAFREIAAHDLEGAVVELFSAFEIALFTFCSRYLDKACASKILRRVLEGRLSAYSMMQLLPEICEELNVRPLTNAVLRVLQDLRVCRNKLLHEGKAKGLTASVLGDYLAAALIAIAFIRYVEQRTV